MGDWGIPIFKHKTYYFLIFKLLSNQIHQIPLLSIRIEKINIYGFLTFKHINKQFSHFQITEKKSNYTVKHIHTSSKIQRLKWNRWNHLHIRQISSM